MATIDAAVERFTNDLKIGAAACTVQTYATGLRAFVSFVGGDKPTSALTLEAIELYAAYLKTYTNPQTNKPLAPASREIYLTALSRFYSFCLRKRIIKFDTAEVEELRVMWRAYRERRQPLPHIPTQEASAKIQAEAERRVRVAKERVDTRGKGGDNWRKYLVALRNLAFMLVLKQSGIRIGEAIGLRRGDIEARKTKARTTYTLKVKGKGSKEGIAYIGRDAASALLMYFEARGDGAQFNARGTASVAVFLPHGRNAGGTVLSNQVLTRQHLESEFRDMREAAGIEEHLTPHWLRGEHADKMLKSSKRIEVVQRDLRHAHIQTTMRYTGATPQDVENEHAKVF